MVEVSGTQIVIIPTFHFTSHMDLDANSPVIYKGIWGKTYVSSRHRSSNLQEPGFPCEIAEERHSCNDSCSKGNLTTLEQLPNWNFLANAEIFQGHNLYGRDNVKSSKNSQKALRCVFSTMRKHDEAGKSDSSLWAIIETHTYFGCISGWTHNHISVSGIFYQTVTCR